MSVKCNQGFDTECTSEAAYFCLDRSNEYDLTEILACVDCERAFVAESIKHKDDWPSRYIYFDTYEDLQVGLIKRRL